LLHRHQPSAARLALRITEGDWEFWPVFGVFIALIELFIYFWWKNFPKMTKNGGVRFGFPWPPYIKKNAL
jgi:hypothetical protein